MTSHRASPEVRPGDPPHLARAGSRTDRAVELPVWPAALTTLVRAEVLSGQATVVASGARGCYLRLDGASLIPPDARGVRGEAGGTGAMVLPVLAADAVALPTAARLGLDAGSVDLAVPVGLRVRLDPRGIDLPQARVAFVRRWTPARVPRTPRVPVVWPPVSDAGDGVDTERAVLVSLLRAALTVGLAGADPGPVVARLIGRGPGLTPSGDDVLAGALLVLHGAGLDPGLVGAVRALAHRTTDLSASLLLAAADGYAAPAVRAHVTAALRGDRPAAEAARREVERFGHWSGPDLLAGCAATLCAISPVLAPPAHRSAS